jgi:imidazolonepropionase-like amidohydrolase
MVAAVRVAGLQHGIILGACALTLAACVSPVPEPPGAGLHNGAFASTYAPLPSEPVLLTGAIVLTGDGSRFDDASVYFADGLIRALGPDVSVPPGTRVVDAAGLWITPGIIDVHSHMGNYPVPGIEAHADGIAFASLSGGSHNARNLSQAAGVAVAHGLDWQAGLEALTAGPARIWGLEGIGRLEAGYEADVVVWDGDPLEVTSYPDADYIKGRAVPMESRQTLLRDRYLERVLGVER